MNLARRILTAFAAWISGAPGWLGGALAGLQAGLLSLACTLIPAWAAAAAAPTVPGQRGPQWSEAARTATHVWLLAFGAPWELDGVQISLAPLGLTAFSALMMVALARRFAAKSWTSWLCTVAAFAGVVVVAASLTSASGEGSTRAVTAAAVSVLVTGPAAAWGIWRAHGATLAWVATIPRAVRTGLRLGVGIVAMHVVAGATLGAWWAITGRSAIGDTATALGVDAVGGASLALLETTFVPTMVVWNMSWLAGPGFHVGLASYTPSAITDAPLPAIPLLGALPHAAGGWWAWAPAVIVVFGVVARIALRHRMPTGWAKASAMAVATLAVGASAAIAGVAASGSIGPGTLSSTGVHASDFALITACLAGAGMAVGEGLIALRNMAVGSPVNSQGPVTPIHPGKTRSAASAKSAPTPATSTRADAVISRNTASGPTSAETPVVTGALGGAHADGSPVPSSPASSTTASTPPSSLRPTRPTR